MSIQNKMVSMTMFLVGGLLYSGITHLAFCEDLVTYGNGQVMVTDRDLAKELSGLNDRQKDAILRDLSSEQQVLEGMASRKTLAKEARELKIDQEPEIKQAVADFEESLLANFLSTKKVSNQLTPAALQKYFAAHRDLYNTSVVHVQQILVSDEAEAKRIKKLAEEQPDKFQDLAEKYSKDPTAKIYRGELGFITRDRLVKNFTDVAFATPTGKIAGPIKTIYGYHVIKVLEKKPGKALEYSEVEIRVLESLRTELIQDYVSKLKEKHKVKIKNVTASKS